MRLISSSIAALMLATGAAQAQVVLAVGVSPDGGAVMVGGDNRTLYTLDAATLEVTDRRWIAETVEQIAFNADGSLVYLRDGEDTLVALDTATMAPAWQMARVSGMHYAAATGQVVTLEARYDGSSLTIADAATGAAVKGIDLGELQVELFAVSDDGMRALALTRSNRSDLEPNESAPADLEGLAEHTFKQQHDGYTSQIVSVDLESGAFEVAETFYRVSFPSDVRVLDGKLLVLNSNNDSAMVAPDGTTHLVDMGEDYFAYAVSTAAGDEIVFTRGGEVKFRPFDPAQPSTAPMLDAGRIPGGAERVTAAAEAADGTQYLATSAYRLLVVPADRSGIAAYPVF